MTERYWIVDYDIPTEPKARRMRFYRSLWRLLRDVGFEADRSTQSVWILDNRKIAESIHALAVRYGQSNLYAARKIT